MLVTTSTNPFFGEVACGVERRCYEKAAANLILCNTEGDSERMNVYQIHCYKKRVDGLMLMCSTLEGEHIDVFERYLELPVVVMDWGPMLFASDKIQDNSHQGGYMATKHLIDNGHFKLAYHRPTASTASSRYEGFKTRMQ